MKKLVLLSIILLLQSCITINESGYRFLSIPEKEYIQPFEQADFQKKRDNSDCFKLFEINTENIKFIIAKQQYTWLHIWLPYCPNESCTNIAQYEEFEKRHSASGLNLSFISSTYDIDDIIKYMKMSNFSKPIYVLQSSYYGVKNKKIRQKFHSEIDPNYKEEDHIFYSDYLFIEDSLVYMGDKMNDSIVKQYITKEKN
jgi:hypothetical protein